MGNISGWEIALLVLVILLVFGPKRLPQIGRSVGRGMREFKETVTDQTRELKAATIDMPKQIKESFNPMAPTEVKSEEPPPAPVVEAPAPVAVAAPPPVVDAPAPAAQASEAQDAPTATAVEDIEDAVVIEEEPAAETQPGR
jgi:sec-independent protein translocase protein TatA